MKSAPADSSAARCGGSYLITAPPNDGWAAQGTGTTGGADASPDHVYIVTNRSELVDALDNASVAPKIIYVSGTIDANVDDNNVPLTCEDYYTSGTTG